MQAVATLPYQSLPRKPVDRSLAYISAIVIGAHALFLIWAALSVQKPLPIIKTPERLIVKTINLNENKKSAPRKVSNKKALAANTSAKTPATPKVEEPIASPEETKATSPAPAEKVAEIEVPAPVAEQVEVVKEEKPLEKKEVKKPSKAKKDTKPQEKKQAKKETSKKTAPKKEVPKKETPKKESPKKTAPKKEPPKKESIKKEEVKKEEPKKAKTETLKEPAKKEASPAKPAAPKIDPKAEAAKAKQRQLLAKAQESIAKIDQNRGNMAATASSLGAFSTTAMPGKIESLHIDALPEESGAIGSSLNVHERSYRDEVAARLKLLLKLPEHGEVKIKLTLTRSGGVKKMAVLNAQSAANRSYIEKKVPTLNFPAFGDNFEGLPDYTFLVSLSNE